MTEFSTEYSEETQRQTLMGMPGGAELIDWIGEVPSFHDAEVVSLGLSTDSSSRLAVAYWRWQRAQNGALRPLEVDQYCLVTIDIEKVLDLELDGFSHQNVLYELAFRPDPVREDRKNHYQQQPGDVEVELGPCFGLCGFIRGRGVSVSLTAPWDRASWLQRSLSANNAFRDKHRL